MPGNSLAALDAGASYHGTDNASDLEQESQRASQDQADAGPGQGPRMFSFKKWDCPKGHTYVPVGVRQNKRCESCYMDIATGERVYSCDCDLTLHARCAECQRCETLLGITTGLPQHFAASGRMDVACGKCNAGNLEADQGYMLCSCCYQAYCKECIPAKYPPYAVDKAS
jgi:hypothetical protein